MAIDYSTLESTSSIDVSQYLYINMWIETVKVIYFKDRFRFIIVFEFIQYNQVVYTCYTVIMKELIQNLSSVK